MCKFCERAGKTVKKITVQKYEQTTPIYDGILGKVQTGTKTSKSQPLIKIETGKGYEVMPMPVEFQYCPHCGRKIKERI